jgi:DNA-binding NarL/FixJ family response regulator
MHTHVAQHVSQCLLVHLPLVGGLPAPRENLSNILLFTAQGPVMISMPTSAETPSTLPTKSPPPYPDDLTSREVEVLRLLAQGLTDAQIAEQLIISSRTVNTHLTSIYGKIQVSSRSAATRYAIVHQLA